MSFNSLQYFWFLAIVVVIYWSLPRARRPLLLLIASYAYYASWDWRLLPLLVFTTAVSFFVGRQLPSLEGTPRRAMMLLGVCTSCLVLGSFKFLASALAAEAAGGLTSVLSLGVPLGLSFYTFQSISYVVDIYRDELEPTESFVDFGAYVSFFPHLLAGPILRAGKMLPALRQVPDRPDTVVMSEGFELLLTGLFKKVVLADPFFRMLRGDLSDFDQVGSAHLWAVSVASIIASYFDIAGYIDIARGSGKLLGITMQPNFAQPLTRSESWTGFWRRWQITIMMWFRDYIFRPVRGSSRSRSREWTAMFVTFFAVGLWHGLTFTWGIWGLLVGGLLVTERELRSRRAQRRQVARRDRRRALAAVRRAEAEGGDVALIEVPTVPGPGPIASLPPVARRAVGLAYVGAALVLTLPWAGALDVSTVGSFYAALFGMRSGAVDLDLLGLLAVAVLALVLLDRRDRTRLAIEGSFDPPGIPRAVGFAVMVVGIVVFSGVDSQPFVYFTF